MAPSLTTTTNGPQLIHRNQKSQPRTTSTYTSVDALKLTKTEQLTKDQTSSKGYKMAESEDNTVIPALYQAVIFGTLFVGYASYTYSRKTFSYAAPTLIGMNLLSQNKMGIINSAQYFAYAISKFLGGILSDKISPRLLFPTGLLISGLSAVSVAFSADPEFWSWLWFLNGLGQGCGWPACSKLIKKWFSSKQFGTCWSLLTASSNVSGTFGPILSAYILITFDWKISFVVSGMFSIIMALISITLLRDSPKNADSSTNSKSADSSKQTNPLPSNEKVSYSDLLKTPLLWIISACYLIVFSTKTALSDWGQVFLMQEFGQSQMEASTFSSALETGGFVGGILAGVVTDKLNKKLTTKGNSRLLVSTLFLLTCAICLHSLVFVTTQETPQVWISLLGLALGGSIFGPISIFGIVASESFSPSVSGASHAFVALAANVGAILAGWPISKLALALGWKSVLMVFEVAVILAVVVILGTTKLHKVPKLKET